MVRPVQKLADDPYTDESDVAESVREDRRPGAKIGVGLKAGVQSRLAAPKSST